MKDKFNQIIKRAEALYGELIKSKSFKWNTVPKEYHTSAGIYLFSEENIPLYIGRTSNLKKRLRNHTRPSHNMATFAFLLARHATKQFKATYRITGSRKDLLKNNPEFKAAFDVARERIKNMDVRFIEEEDSTVQAILEIYTAYVSKAKYNDFKNH